MRCDCQTFGFAVAVLVLLASDALGGLSPPETRTIPSADGEYLLVLVIPKDEREYRWQGSISKQEEIEKLYSQSGLYRNDGSTDLLWPIQYFPTPKDIYVCNDGVHLVVAFLNWDGTASDRGNALEFYAYGQQLANYNEDGLLVGYLARLVLSNLLGLDFPTGTTANIDENSQSFEIRTNWGDVFRFDVTTGKIIEAQWPWSIKAVFISIVVLLAISGSWFFRRMFQRKPAA